MFDVYWISEAKLFLILNIGLNSTFSNFKRSSTVKSVNFLLTSFSEITVTPLLIRKGKTKFAMYGLSSVKDERLYRLFREGRVHMLRPEEETEEWFNLLALHQV